MYRGQKVLAIIPARGGSKRLPQKNILSLNNKPLIAWTIEVVKKSKYIDTLIISTDSEKIAKISKKYGAEVPFIRPADLASDTATSMDVILHAIYFLKNESKQFDYIVLLQPTSPLRTVEDIDNAFKMLNDKTKAVVSVCETEHSPLWSNTLPENRSMKNFIKPEIKNLRSQDLPRFFRLNGAIYLSERNYLLQNEGFLGEHTKAFIMPVERSVDIDNKIDFELCKVLMNENNKNNSKA